MVDESEKSYSVVLTPRFLGTFLASNSSCVRVQDGSKGSEVEKVSRNARFL